MSGTALQRMMSLFAGFSGAYGTHGKTEPESGGKLGIKKSASTKRSPVTEKLWADHLAGKHPIGIIPVTEDATCHWGTIDVDKYDLNLAHVATDIERRKLPLVPCRSKSGGAHLFLFVSKPISATDMQSKLKDIAAMMGYGDCEIFPKQTEILLDRGDLGNWLNMPYFGSDSSDRYGIKKTGLAMTLDEFLKAAEAKRLSPKEFAAISTVAAAAKTKTKTKSKAKSAANGSIAVGPFGDGPPCLQHLANAGVTSEEHSRNRALFAMGVYCKKKWPDAWQKQLEEMNHKFMKPPLPADEVAGLVKSLGKKDYNYACSEHPLVNHCNAGVCRTQVYGVGISDEYPVISSLSVLATDPPLWFVDIDGRRLEISTDDLQKYQRFHVICMERLHRCFPPLKQTTWLSQIGAAMANVITIEAPPDTGERGHFMELLEEFLLNRNRGTKKEDVLTGRPWQDEAEGRHYFRMRDLTQFLFREGIKNLTRAQISTRIRDIGGDRQFMVIKGRGQNLWWVPSEQFQTQPTIDTPKIERDPI